MPKISKKTWEQVKTSTHRMMEGKLPEGDYWMTEKMPWMTDEGWNDYQKRLSEVDYKERKTKKSG